MLDRDGYRPNVAIVIASSKNQVFWGKRIREHSWQFPQGGINPGETIWTGDGRKLHVLDVVPLEEGDSPYSGFLMVTMATLASSRTP